VKWTMVVGFIAKRKRFSFDGRYRLKLLVNYDK
jgi:hypothetical protein